MDWFVRRFVKASLVWFALGMSLGVFMTVRPALIVYRPAHVHMNLLGFVSMMIFGVAYHVIPRFTGHPLHSRRLAGAHWWLSNAGLALLVAGFALTVSFRNEIRLVLIAGGVLSAAGGATFIVNVWRTIDRERSGARRRPGQIRHPWHGCRCIVSFGASSRPRLRLRWRTGCPR